MPLLLTREIPLSPAHWSEWARSVRWQQKGCVRSDAFYAVLLVDARSPSTASFLDLATADEFDGAQVCSHRWHPTVKRAIAAPLSTDLCPGAIDGGVRLPPKVVVARVPTLEASPFKVDVMQRSVFANFDPLGAYFPIAFVGPFTPYTPGAERAARAIQRMWQVEIDRSFLARTCAARCDRAPDPTTGGGSASPAVSGGAAAGLFEGVEFVPDEEAIAALAPDRRAAYQGLYQRCSLTAATAAEPRGERAASNFALEDTAGTASEQGAHTSAEPATSDRGDAIGSAVAAAGLDTVQGEDRRLRFVCPQRDRHCYCEYSALAAGKTVLDAATAFSQGKLAPPPASAVSDAPVNPFASVASRALEPAAFLQRVLGGNNSAEDAVAKAAVFQSVVLLSFAKWLDLPRWSESAPAPTVPKERGGLGRQRPYSLFVEGAGDVGS
jgi:hypothetical protein